jgi:hypothetical protein
MRNKRLNDGCISFGIPPQLKRDLENKALETMGENKASYLTKSYVEKIPASDQKDVRELKKGVGNAAGGALQNPLGGFVSWLPRLVSKWNLTD